ncbi:MAG: Lar family restriction alleviation protein [Oscillibacter sp.]|nr:Lar family restriction alleviation protein [Oscillibacter sp.]
MFDLHSIELEDCPICRGTGLMQEENGWCVYVECLDCGSHTAELRYDSEAERETAARQAAGIWNMGKVINTAAGD